MKKFKVFVPEKAHDVEVEADGYKISSFGRIDLLKKEGENELPIASFPHNCSIWPAEE